MLWLRFVRYRQPYHQDHRGPRGGPNPAGAANSRRSAALTEIDLDLMAARCPVCPAIRSRSAGNATDVSTPGRSRRVVKNGDQDLRGRLWRHSRNTSVSGVTRWSVSPG